MTTGGAGKVLDLLARYDDDALAALASRGLLRRARKDLENSTPTVRSDGDDVVVETGGQVVRFGATGAVGAHCSCPAVGVCQHVLTAVLATAATAAADHGDEATRAGRPPDLPVGAQPDSVPAGELTAGPGATTAITVDLLPPAEALAAITSADLLAHAGTSGYRWAWQLVEDLETADNVRVEIGRAILIRFLRPAMTFRYVGGPIDGVLVDPPPRQLDRYRVAAVLAYQRACGQSPTPPPPTRTRRDAPTQDGLDLGRELADDGSLTAQRDRARRRVRAAASTLVIECIELGLAHLSGAVQERFAALALSAQAAEYHRLALMVRRIADHIELLHERHAAADEQRLLDELALVAALVAALDAASTRGSQPVHLVGRARGTFDASGTLDLIGLGARPWRSASGYLGLTTIFLAPATGTFLSWSEARPASVGGLDPVARYRAAGPWTGLTCPAAATGRRLVLVGAKASDAGRLSGSETTTATVAPFTGDLAAALTPQPSWSQLRNRFAAHRRNLLAAPDPMGEWTVLAPARFGPAIFDENRQTLDWPLLDTEDEVLHARISYQPLTAAAIDRVQQLSDHTPAGTLVVVRLTPSPEGLVADPLSVVHPTPGRDGVHVEALAFPTSPPAPPPGSTRTAKPANRKGFVRRRAMTEPDASPATEADETGHRVGDLVDDMLDHDVAMPRGVPPTPIRELRVWLQRTAERGLSPAAITTTSADLVRLLDGATSAGLTAFGPLKEPTSQAHDLAGRLLKLQALCLQYELFAVLTSG